jgi:hypothetical protein
MRRLALTDGRGRRSLAAGAASRTRPGSISNHAPEPRRQNPAATRKEAAQPKRPAIAGVSEAVTAPPIWAPIFMKPETEPDDEPAISDVTDQNEL